MPPSDARGESHTIKPHGAAQRDAAAEKQVRARRRSSVAIRYPEVQDAIKRLADEREALTATLQDRNGSFGEEVKNLRERRSYVATRLEILRSERKELVEERKFGRPGDAAAWAHPVWLWRPPGGRDR